MNFKVGDKVKISNDLESLIDKGYLDIIGSMFKFAGKDAEIKRVCPHQKEFFLLDIDDGFYVWHEDLLTRVEP